MESLRRLNEFCANVSRRHGEPLHGTATHVTHMIFIESYDGWPADVGNSSIVRIIKSRLEKLGMPPESTKICLIKGVETRRRTVVVASLSDNSFRLTRFQIDDYAELGKSDLRSRFENAMPFEAPGAVFVCTHGTHDPCCAKFGYPLYSALTDNTALRVWQCSHLGGDRFAGNALCMPDGLLYGRLDAEDSAALESAICRRKVILEKYRGRCNQDGFTQAGERSVRVEYGILDIDDLIPEPHTPTNDGDFQEVRFRHVSTSRSYSVLVRRTTSSPQRLTTCRATEPKCPVRYLQVGRVVQL